MYRLNLCLLTNVRVIVIIPFYSSLFLVWMLANLVNVFNTACKVLSDAYKMAILQENQNRGVISPIQVVYYMC